MKIRRSLFGLLLLAHAISSHADRAGATECRLGSWGVSGVEQEWGEARVDRSVDGHPLKIGDRSFEHGVGTHAASTWQLALDGQGERFEAQVGVDSEVGAKGAVVFRLEADGREIYHSGTLRGGEAPEPLSVALDGVKTLTLLVEPVGYGNQFAHADWADAVLVMKGGQPRTVAIPKEAAVILTPPPAAAPRINGARIFGVRPDAPFLFTVAATGERPLSFAADGLPAGLQLDARTGRITGTLMEKGEYAVTLHAKNARGEARRPFKIVCGATVGLTPAMGWNSWNCFASAVTADHVMAAADEMVSTGLIDHGWTYINIDDFWQVSKDSQDPTLQGPHRDAQGNILPNPRFPDMRQLADYVHGKGLKIGLYSSPGPWTCGGCVASWQHEEQDARQYAAWGFDYLKYDWCTYNDVVHGDHSLPTLKKPYEVMRAGLDKVGRDIVFSFCQYGWGDVWKWGAATGGNSWRTTDDIVDSWVSMSGNGFGEAGEEAFAGPGHFNDPDMLVVGKVGWGPQLHATRLTPNEQYTHLSLWCLLDAPLLIGCDMTQLDPFTLGLLTNDEVIDVNQDPLGRQAAPVSREGTREVWSKVLEDGSRAVGLFNRGRTEARVTAKWSDLGLAGPQTVRDLWRQKDVGEFGDRYEATVPPHGVVLVKIGVRADGKPNVAARAGLEGADCASTGSPTNNGTH